MVATARLDNHRALAFKEKELIGDEENGTTFSKVQLDTNNSSSGLGHNDRQISEENFNENDPDGCDSTIIKCSAVHTLERDIPDFDYSHLVKELRNRFLDECEKNPGLYGQVDIDKCRNDLWQVERFLLRQKLDVEAAFEMLKAAMRYKNESLVSSIRAEDFPAEFYMVGGLFSYGHDRKGNKMLYMRIKVHRKIPEIQAVLEGFVYYHINRIDHEARGRGITMVLDCAGAGLASADMDTLMFIISCLKNYFPKGLSYFLVHELPWILKPFWHIARLCIPDEYTQLIKFSNSKSIYEYIDSDQLPDFLGGTCENDYRKVPENCTTLREASKLWGIEKEIIRKIIMRFMENLPPETMEQVELLDEEIRNEQNEAE